MTASQTIPFTDSRDREQAGSFFDYIALGRPEIENALRDLLPVCSAPGTERFNEALTRAIFPGGKRLRPHLTRLAARLGGASDQQALMLGCAIEFIHNSSIILDDLPCMDDAGLRRNSPTLHIVYGEGTALLVAVSLLNQAYALFARSCDDQIHAARLPGLISEATQCLGNSGMIAGQAAELMLSGTPTDESVLSSRVLKTTGLMRLMMVAGAIVAGASEKEIDALATFGECLGKSYQIYDDLADTLDSDLTIGKSVGQDQRHLRPTAVVGLTSDEVQFLAAEIMQAGKHGLDHFGNRFEAQLLRSAADQIVAGLNPTAPF